MNFQLDSYQSHYSSHWIANSFPISITTAKKNRSKSLMSLSFNQFDKQIQFFCITFLHIHIWNCKYLKMYRIDKYQKNLREVIWMIYSHTIFIPSISNHNHSSKCFKYMNFHFIFHQSCWFCFKNNIWYTNIIHYFFMCFYEFLLLKKWKIEDDGLDLVDKSCCCDSWVVLHGRTKKDSFLCDNFKCNFFNNKHISLYSRKFIDIKSLPLNWL